MRNLRRRSWAPVVLIALLSAAVEAQAQRPLTVDDLLTFEEIASVTESPDGEWLAVVITRPRTEAETYRIMPSTWEVDHADIWLVPRSRGEPRNITNGLADGSGYWNPVWSPDGQRLAMLSTKGGDNIRAYVWDRKTEKVRRVTERGIDPYGPLTEEWPAVALLWRDSTTLLVPVLPDGMAAPYIDKIRSNRDAVKAWAKAEKGAEPSVSVLQSGRELSPEERPVGHLLAVNTASGQSRIIGEGNFRRLLLSPTGRHLALIAETGRIPPPPLLARADGLGVWRTRLALLALDGGAKPVWIDGVYDPDAKTPMVPHAWSPDGSTLAVIGKSRMNEAAPRTMFLVSAETNAARRVTGEHLDVSAAGWSPAGEPLAMAARRASGDHPAGRPEWWTLDPMKGREIRPLTAGLDTVPDALLPGPLPHTMLGLAAGDLWVIDVRGRSSNGTADLVQRIDGIVWPTPARARARTPDKLIVETSDDGLLEVSFKGGAVSTAVLPRPSKTARLATFDPTRRLAAYTGTEPDGTFLWTATALGGGFARRIALNERARQIAEPERRLIRYTSVDGDSLQALVVLPTNYRKGRRYPVVTWVHHGAEVLDTTYFGQLDKQSVSSLNRLLLPAHGYVLLIPSMPVPQRRVGTDPYLDMPKTVMPAIDRILELGIGDSSKLGLIGHSYGGYSTYSLVTYTSRFKAAVAIAGASNLVSAYGTFSGSDRYAPNAHEGLFTPAWSENQDGQGQMYAPPWENLWRYVRNSPLYYVERVRTPLMIIHGDIDYVPVQQGEEFFTGLYRLGKEAQFVRYWGEGHSMESPANMRDMWRRIFSWFDGYFGVAGAAEEASHPVRRGAR